MYYAAPAKPAAPAVASATPTVEPIENDPGYVIEPAIESDLVTKIEAAPKVDVAEEVHDARKYAPTKQLDESYVKDSSMSPDELKKSSSGGVDFSGAVAISRGLKVTCMRRIFPFLFDPRDFISYGEAARYVVLKDGLCFVYLEEKDVTPLYTIPLEDSGLVAKKENPHKPHKTSVTISPMTNTNLQRRDLETILFVDARNTLAYQFTFDVTKNKESADMFLIAAKNITDGSKNNNRSAGAGGGKKEKTSLAVSGKVL